MNGIMNSLVLDTIMKILVGFIQNCIDTFSSYMNDLFKMSNEFLQADFVTSTTKFTFSLGVAVMVLLAIAQLIKLYVLPDSGEPEEDIQGFFTRLGKAVLLMCFSTELCTIIVTFTNFVANDILGIIGTSEVTSSFMESLNVINNKGYNSAIAIVLILLIALICFFIIMYQAIRRGIELAIMQIVAPLFAVNYITTDKGLWNKWLQNTLSVALTYVFQLFLTNIGLKYISLGINNMYNMFIGIVWLIVCISCPKLLKEFAFSSGNGGQSVKSLASGAIQSVVMKKL